MAKIKNVDPKIIEAEEHFLIDCQLLLQETIADKNVTRSVLADRAGISKARLSQIMRAEANPTVKTMARLFHALGEELELRTKKRGDAAAGEPNVQVAPPDSNGDLTWPKALLKEAKESSASNDNNGPVVFMEGDVMTALEAA
ncbi:MAG TPA: helix-turn-helix transcriptional regulator [Paraburkholderia sp.]|uniref:helix-turn-helix domain-containing protein n=1 Tax=Paraburkholderia sp. TaxID=1926495 RepID=UPI002ED15E58